MRPSISQKVLGINKLYLDYYITDTINLVKSINIVSSTEADSYNELIKLTFPTYEINYQDKTTWQYYLHLNAKTHPLDRPIELISLDNGDTVILTPASINNHRQTKNELLRFSDYYKELVSKYPTQELYIKSCITAHRFTSIESIIEQPDFTIISYNDDLVEPNEDDIIFLLDNAIQNYKVTKLIPYYSLSDNLFMASMYHVLYNFMVTTILSIRLANAKTLKAHTFHVKNYLASHHRLDEHIRYLSYSQIMFLYRNLLYLNNHTGKTYIFQELIDKLFTPNNISVVTYEYIQANSTTPTHEMDFYFRQKLLNKADLVYQQQDFSLQDVLAKEYPLTINNQVHLERNFPEIKSDLHNSLDSKTVTKMIETILTDATDSVRHKIMPTVLDYWGYMVKNDLCKYLISFTDPFTTKLMKLTTADAYKLYYILLHKRAGITLEEYPPVYLKRVLNPTRKSNQELIGMCYEPIHWYSKEIDRIKASLPSYRATNTSYEFKLFVESIYQLNISLWVYTSSFDNKHNNANFEKIIEALHMFDIYQITDETPAETLGRLGLDITKYDNLTMDKLLYSLVNSVYDNSLEFVNFNKYLQVALTNILKRFTAYTTQFVTNYTSQGNLLVGPKDVRTCHYLVSSLNKFFYKNNPLFVNARTDHKQYSFIQTENYYNYKIGHYTDVTLDVVLKTQISVTPIYNLHLYFPFIRTPILKTAHGYRYESIVIDFALKTNYKVNTVSSVSINVVNRTTHKLSHSTTDVYANTGFTSVTSNT